MQKHRDARELRDVVSLRLELPTFGLELGTCWPVAYDVWPIAPVFRTPVFSAGSTLRSAPALRACAPLRVDPALKTSVLRTFALAKRLQLQAKRPQLQAKRLQLQTPVAKSRSSLNAALKALQEDNANGSQADEKSAPRSSEEFLAKKVPRKTKSGHFFFRGKNLGTFFLGTFF